MDYVNDLTKKQNKKCLNHDGTFIEISKTVPVGMISSVLVLHVFIFNLLNIRRKLLLGNYYKQTFPQERQNMAIERKIA